MRPEDQERMESWVQRVEAAAAKSVVAAEGMCEAANKIGEAIDQFGNEVQNLEGAFRKNRQYSK